MLLPSLTRNAIGGPGNPSFLDTSVMVAGTIDFGITSMAAMRLLDAIAAEEIAAPMTSWHCWLEFYAVVTLLPSEYRLSPSDAHQILDEDVLERWTVCDLPKEGRQSFLRGMVRDRVVGGRLYDAHIAEIARSVGARTVITENGRHFTTLMRDGIRVLSAAELVADPDFPAGEES
jgi:hypothetical protein